MQLNRTIVQLNENINSVSYRIFVSKNGAKALGESLLSSFFTNTKGFHIYSTDSTRGWGNLSACQVKWWKKTTNGPKTEKNMCNRGSRILKKILKRRKKGRRTGKLGWQSWWEGNDDEYTQKCRNTFQEQNIWKGRKVRC